MNLRHEAMPFFLARLGASPPLTAAASVDPASKLETSIFIRANVVHKGGTQQ
jgi:hypothetical protein